MPPLARPDRTTYVCGLSGDGPLPEDPAEVGPDPGAPERLRAIVRAVAPALGGAEVLEARACHRPVTADGLPLLGRVPGVAGAYVATGHGPWGILNGPASGEALWQGWSRTGRPAPSTWGHTTRRGCRRGNPMRPGKHLFRSPKGDKSVSHS